MLIRRNDRTGVIGVVCADFTFYSFLFILDIFWSIFFFPLELHTLEECTGSGELSVRPLFGYVGVCILYLFMHCLSVSHIISGLLMVILNLFSCTAY